jgi:hypothetical protein
MNQDQRAVIERELEELRARVATLEDDLASGPPVPRWQARGFYAAYYATTGFMLGIFGAAASLLLNIVGSALVGQHPLKLIQVYLTFPLGDRVLDEKFLNESGLLLAVGCCLYIGTGMLLGTLFQMTLGWFTHEKQVAGLPYRLLIATLLAVGVWLVVFYGILSWLQPAVVGGQQNIIDLVPWYVGLLTHLVYGWTMAVVYPLGEYRPYRLPSE